MVILITGASHTGKTLLAQRLLETCGIPYVSADHLKMGLIRSGYTDLTPEDDDALTDYLWPVLREMVKTVVENRQSLTVEGCYIPARWRRDFGEGYLAHIRFVCLAMTEDYIGAHFEEIRAHGCDIEKRLYEEDLTPEGLMRDNRTYIDAFRAAGEPVTLIDGDWARTAAALLPLLGG